MILPQNVSYFVTGKRDLIEDSHELDEEAKKELVQARQEIKEGKYHTLEEVKKELGF